MAAHPSQNSELLSLGDPRSTKGPVLTRIYSLSHIHPRLNVPVRAILVASVFNFIFGLLYLGMIFYEYCQYDRSLLTQFRAYCCFQCLYCQLHDLPELLLRCANRCPSHPRPTDRYGAQAGLRAWPLSWSGGQYYSRYVRGIYLLCESSLHNIGQCLPMPASSSSCFQMRSLSTPTQ